MKIKKLLILMFVFFLVVPIVFSATANNWNRTQFENTMLNYFNSNETDGFSGDCADLDNDGDFDCLGNSFQEGGTGNSTYHSFRNIGTPSYPNWEYDEDLLLGLKLNAEFGKFSNIAFADLNNDGDYDFISGTANGSVFGVENIGSVAIPEWRQNDTLILGLESTTICGANNRVGLGDLDNDDDFDLAVGGLTARCFNIYENIGNITTPEFVRNEAWESATFDVLPNVNTFLTPDFIDYNGDGLQDIVLSFVNSSGTRCTAFVDNIGTSTAPLFNSFLNVELQGNLPICTSGTTGIVNTFTYDLDNNGIFDLCVLYTNNAGDGIHNNMTCYSSEELDLLYNLFEPCESDAECTTGNCEYGFCNKKGQREECENDFQCLSGECINDRCTKPSIWLQIDNSKNQQFGDDSNSNNFIALFFMLGFAVAIIFIGGGSSGAFAGAITWVYVSGFFFAIVGYLSPFILLGMIIVALLIFVLSFVAKGSSD